LARRKSASRYATRIESSVVYLELEWSVPVKVVELEKSDLPASSGVYVFTDHDAALVPNPPRLPENHPKAESRNAERRSTPGVLYVGKAKNLRSRVFGYKFRPYLSIKRRPKGTPPRHVADRHRGRALLHAQQYFGFEGLEPPLYVRWASVSKPGEVEDELIMELLPYLNKIGKPKSER